MKRLAIAVLTSALIGCGAPRAERIEGDISKVIEKSFGEGSETFDHVDWDEILSAYVRDGGRHFDYAGLKREEAKLHRYLDRLAEADLASLLPTELEALLINAYNAFTIRTVLDHVTEEGGYQIESIRDVPDVFSREAHVVGGFTLSLDNIEHNILRPYFKDPRIHFSVNCASTSCPPLAARAFLGDTLDRQLDAATRATLSNPDYVQVEDGALVLTKILEWYGGDFVNPDFRGAEDTLPAFIARYATEDVRAFIEAKDTDVPIRFRDYDWRLNRP